MSVKKSSKQTLLLGALAALIAGAYFFTTDRSAPVAPDEAQQLASEQPAAPAESVVDNATEEAAHPDDCAHCQAAAPAVTPTMLKSLDAVFADLAASKDRIIPKSTFDFFHGARYGQPASVELAGRTYTGQVTVAREDHELARTYGMALDDDLGAMIVSTDGAGFMRGHVLFKGDSRAISFKEVPQGKDVHEPSVVLAQQSISDIFCAPLDAIYVGPGVKSPSGAGRISEAALVAAAEEAEGDGEIPIAADLIIPVLNSITDPADYQHVMFLDFGGGEVRNTPWNVTQTIETDEEYLGLNLDLINVNDLNEVLYPPIKYAPKSRADEPQWVQQIWRRVVEDYAPFQINVTTDKAVYEAADVDKRLHVVITSTGDVFPSGVAHLYSYRENSPVVWVVQNYFGIDIVDEALIASTISHEAGHAFGLRHDYETFYAEGSGEDYYLGHNGSYTPGWAPIMGAFDGDDVADEVEQWSIGEFPNSANSEDDVAILGDTTDPQLEADEAAYIEYLGTTDSGQNFYDLYYQTGIEVSNGFGFVQDDHEEALDSGRAIIGLETEDPLVVTTTTSGVISSRDDKDVFRVLPSDSGLMRIIISPLDVDSPYFEGASFTSGANLAVDAQLLDSEGAVIFDGRDFGGNELSSVIEGSVDAAEEYYLVIDGGGRGDNPQTGFSDYGSLGEYNIRAEFDVDPLAVYGSSGKIPTTLVPNGSTTVDEVNGTAFGTTPLAVDVAHPFLLDNLATIEDIEILSFTFESGQHFRVSPANPTGIISPTSSGKLVDIVYDPASTGLHEDTAIITYDSLGETLEYRFMVNGAATQSATRDNYESNDNYTTAYADVPEDTWLSDYQGLAFFAYGQPSDTLDWYKFTVGTNDDLLTVATSYDPAQGSIEFELYDSNPSTGAPLTNDPIGITTASNGILQFSIPSTYTGKQRTFYLLAKTLDPGNPKQEYDLIWAATEFVSGDDDNYESNPLTGDENDIRANATQITSESPPRFSDTDRGLGLLKDEDWYYFKIEENDTLPLYRMLYVAAEFDHTQGNIDIQVFYSPTENGPLDENVNFFLDWRSATTKDKEVVTAYFPINIEQTDPEAIDYPGENYVDNILPDGNNNIIGLRAGYYYIHVTGDYAENEYDLIVEPLQDDAYELVAPGVENDVRSTAYSLEESILNTWLSEIDGLGTSANYVETQTEGVISATPDSDWYSFTIDASEVVEQISVQYYYINGVIDIALLDSAGNVIATNLESGEFGVITAAAPTGNTFYVHVIAEDLVEPLGGYDFMVTYSAEPLFIPDPIEDNYEENDNFLEPYNISSNEGRYLSSLAGYGFQLDPDWYAVNIPSNASKVEATLFHVAADGDMDLFFSRDEGATLFRSEGGGNTESIVWDDPEAGDYTLTVIGENRGNFYNLLWDITYFEDNYEENDTQAEAFDLTGFERRLLSKLDGLGIQRDDDWYRIRANADTAELRVIATFNHSAGDIDLSLYDSNGELVDFSITTNNNEEIRFQNPNADDYFVRVHFGNGGNEYDLIWAALEPSAVSQTEVPDDAYEENDTREQPYPILADQPRLSRDQVDQDGNLTGLAVLKDADWYEIIIPEDNTGLRVECTFDDSLGDIDFEVYDPLGFPLFVRDSTTDNELLDVRTPIPAGTYTIRVYGPALGNQYDLYWRAYLEDAYEENDNVNEAYDINTLLGSPLSDNAVPTLGDEDWFKFNVDGVQQYVKVTLDYQDLDGAINFHILDSNRNIIATADSTEDQDVAFLQVANGTHYIQVYGDYAYNPYDLTVEVVGDDQFEDNDVREDAADITDLENQNIFAAQFDDDWYKFSVTESNTFLNIICNFTHANGNIDLAVYRIAQDNSLELLGSSTTELDGETVSIEGDIGDYLIHVTGDDINPRYVLRWGVDLDDQYEPNDVPEESADVTQLEGVQIDAVHFDDDWFEVVVSPGFVKLTVDILFEHDEGNLNLSLYSKDGEGNFELLSTVDSETNNETLVYPVDPFASGDVSYYVLVAGQIGTGNPYTLIWQTSNEDNFEGEGGNNIFEDASTDLLASEGRRISQTIGYGGALDNDWYQVAINPGDDGIIIEAFFIHTDETNIDIELFSAGGTFLARSIGFSNVERIHYKGGPGTYYLKIFGKSGENPYDLIWNSYKEDNLELGIEDGPTPTSPPQNDSPDTPRGLGPSFFKDPEINVSTRGTRDLEFIILEEITQLDEDWYAIEVFDDEDIFILNLEFEHDQGDVDVALYREVDGGDPILVAQAETETDDEQIILRDLPPGDYLICVYGFGILSPKSDSSWVSGREDGSGGWIPGTYDPIVPEEYSTIVENDAPGGFDYYDLADSHARGLANTYSLRWLSSAEDRYDIETPSADDVEINDSFDTAADPVELYAQGVEGVEGLLDQFDVQDGDGIIDDTTRTVSLEGPDGNVSQPYKAFYRYQDLAQFDDDWFKFTINTGTDHIFLAAISFNPKHGNLGISVYDADNNPLAEVESSTAGIEFITIEGVGAKTYYVKVTGNDLGVPYSLLVSGATDDLYEENDDLEQADEQANITHLNGVDGNASFIQRDDDIFRVDIPEHQVHLNVYVTGYEFITPSVEVVDASGNPLPGGYEQSGGTTSFDNISRGVISPEAGTYYFKVTGIDAGFPYTLEWSFDNEDEYEDYNFLSHTAFDNNTPTDAFDLTRFRLEPLYLRPPAQQPLDPIKAFGFDYGLLGALTLGDPGYDPFGHAIQDDDDWYSIQIPSWFLTNANKGSKTVQVIKRHYYVRLFAEIEFDHVDGDIQMEIWEDHPDDGFTLLGRSESNEDIESLKVRVDPTDEDRVYYIRVYGEDKANDYSLKWDVTKVDAYEELEDLDDRNDTNGFVNKAYNLTNADGNSTEGTWLHEVEYLQDVNGDNIINLTDGGVTSANGYGVHGSEDDWYAVVVSEGSTQIEVGARFYSDDDQFYEYAPDELDIDFEVYFLAGNDNDPTTDDLRKPVLVGRSTGDTDQSLFVGTGAESHQLPAGGDITTEILENLELNGEQYVVTEAYDVEEPGIYFIRIYYDNRNHPYTFIWDDIGDTSNEGDADIIEDYLTGNWSFEIPDDDSYEENDTLGTAFLLSAEQPRLSRLDGRGIQKDEDWYAFDVPEGNTGLTIECLFDDRTGPIDFEFLNSAGEVLHTLESDTDNELLVIDTPVDAGTYYVRVYGANLGTIYDLYWRAHVEDVYEENDSSEEAFDITSEETVTELGVPLSQNAMPTLTDEDWFQFTIEGENPYLQVRLDYLEVDGAIDFEVLDADLNVLATADSTDDSEIVFILVSSGLHYIRVYGDYAQNPYDLTVSVFGFDDEYEDNDTLATATPIGGLPLVEAAQYDDDWYQVPVIPAFGRLQVDVLFDGDNGNIDLEVYDSNNGLLIPQTSSDLEDAVSFELDVAAGDYYIRVFGDNRNPLYQLTWNLIADDGFEQNDVSDDAAILGIGTEDVAQNAVQLDDDWYRVPVFAADLTLSVDLVFAHVNGNIDLEIYDAFDLETPLGIANSLNDNESLTVPASLENAVYYIRVLGSNVGNNYTLTWNASVEDIYEGERGNNTFDEASKVLLDAKGRFASDTTGFASSTDEDWYEIEVAPGDDQLTVSVAYETPTFGNVFVELFEVVGGRERRISNAVAVASSPAYFPWADKTDPTESEVKHIGVEGLSAGTYYIRVFGDLFGTTYDLIWNSSSEDGLEISRDNEGNIYHNDGLNATEGDGLAPQVLYDGLIDRELLLLQGTLFDEDWYFIASVDPDEDLVVEVEFDHEMGDIDMQLYGGELGVPLLASSTTLTNKERIVYPGSNAGFYIRVFGTRGNTYSLRFNMVKEDTYEENDLADGTDAYDLTTANDDTQGGIPVSLNSIPLSDLRDGRIFVEDPDAILPSDNYGDFGVQLDDDWFSVDMTGTEAVLVVNLSHGTNAVGNLDLQLYVQGADGLELISTADEGNGVETLTIPQPEAERYYFRVYGDDFGTTYDLVWRTYVDDSFEENDALESAVDITANRDLGLGASFFEDDPDNRRYLSEIETNGIGPVQRDADYYKITIPEDQIEIVVDWIPQLLTEDLSVSILGPDGQVLVTEDAAQRIAFNLAEEGLVRPGGDFYIRVTGDDLGSSYDFSWSYHNVDNYDDGSLLSDLSIGMLLPPFDPQKDPPYRLPMTQLNDLDGNAGLGPQGGSTPGAGYAIQASDDYYLITVPAWTHYRENNEDVLRPTWHAQLTVEVFDFDRSQGNIQFEITDEQTGLVVSSTSADTNAERFSGREIVTVPSWPNILDNPGVDGSPTPQFTIRVFGDNAANSYDLKWSVSLDDGYEDNNFIDRYFDLTDGEDSWLSLRSIDGDGIGDGMGTQLDDDWFMIVVSDGSPELHIDSIFRAADGDIDLELYQLVLSDPEGIDGSVRKPQLILADGAHTLEPPIDGLEPEEGVEGISVLDPDAGIYFVRVTGANRGNPYNLYWRDSVDDPDGDEAYLNETWSFDIPQLLLAEPYVNADGDIFANWAEFALGLDPNQADAPVFSQQQEQIGGEDYYVFSFLRRKDAVVGGYQFIVYESEDMNFGTDEAVLVRSEDVGFDLERVFFRSSKPLDEQDKCFFRLTVREPSD